MLRKQSIGLVEGSKGAGNVGLERASLDVNNRVDGRVMVKGNKTNQRNAALRTY